MVCVRGRLHAVRYKLSALIRHQDSRQQCVGGLNRSSHVFGFSKLLHVLLRIIGEAGIASRIPIVELDALGAFQVFGSDGKRETKNVQRMGDILLGNVVHGRECAKEEEPCQMTAVVFYRLDPVLRCHSDAFRHAHG